jgi:hypothetical protein
VESLFSSGVKRMVDSENIVVLHDADEVEIVLRELGNVRLLFEDPRNLRISWIELSVADGDTNVEYPESIEELLPESDETCAVKLPKRRAVGRKKR